MILFRTIHIFAAMFWVGSALLTFFFLEPAAKQSSPDGPRFMSSLMTQGKLSIWIGISAIATVISGFLLYFKVSDGFTLSWIESIAGVQFTIGSIAGIMAFFIGLLFIAPTTTRLTALGAEIEKTGKPNPKQKAEISRLQVIMAKASRADLILLVLALTLMIIAPEFAE